jgi:uncharacterized membrane protein YdjX (TVP38/TMEM64 family)
LWGTVAVITRKATEVLEKPLKKKKTRASAVQVGIKQLWPVVLIGAVLVAAVASGWHQHLSFKSLSDNRDALMAWASANEAAAVLGFVGAYILVVAASIPGKIWMTMAGGFLFGTIPGAILTLVGTTVGSALLFIAVRYAFREFVATHLGPRLRRLDSGFHKNEFNYLLALRLAPVFPFWMVNLGAALLGVRFWTFIATTLLGGIPGSFIYSKVGSGIGEVIDAGEVPDAWMLFEPSVLALLFGLALISLLPVALERYRARRAIKSR